MRDFWVVIAVVAFVWVVLGVFVAMTEDDLRE